jgi:hypothetical protein
LASFYVRTNGQKIVQRRKEEEKTHLEPLQIPLPIQLFTRCMNPGSSRKRRLIVRSTCLDRPNRGRRRRVLLRLLRLAKEAVDARRQPRLLPLFIKKAPLPIIRHVRSSRRPRRPTRTRFRRKHRRRRENFFGGTKEFRTGRDGTEGRLVGRSVVTGEVGAGAAVA